MKLCVARAQAGQRLLSRRFTPAAMFLLACSPAWAEPIAVTIQPVTSVASAASRSAPAEVVPANRTTLAAEIPARIKRIATDVGVDVKKGELLVQLDDRDYALALRRARANLAAAEAQIEQAETQLKRAEKLAENRYASDDEVLTLSTNLTVAKRNADIQRVEVEAARTNLGRTKIVAPFDGVIEARAAQEGAYVLSGNALLTITQTSGREVSAELHPDLVQSLRSADSVSFDNAGETLPLNVDRISDIVDPESRLQTVRLKFSDEVSAIGSTGSIRWAQAGGQIPIHLIVQRNGKLGVFVAEGNNARFEVLPGASEGRSASHNLAPGTQVIVEGRLRLQNGDSIEIRDQ